ncbi:hypothetical protein QQ045_001970 [Rhodiola kirilowii]
MISTIGISVIVGWGYILGITFAVTDISQLLSTENDAGGYAIAEVFCQVFKDIYGSGVGGIICLGVAAGAVFFCGMTTITSNSRRWCYAIFFLSGQSEQTGGSSKCCLAICFLVSFCMSLATEVFGKHSGIQRDGINCDLRPLHCLWGMPIFFRVTLGRKSVVPSSSMRDTGSKTPLLRNSLLFAFPIRSQSSSVCSCSTYTTVKCIDSQLTWSHGS